MRLRIRLIPALRRTHASMRKIRCFRRLPVGLERAAFVRRYLAVVAGAAGCGAVFYLGAGEVAFNGGVDAGFEGWGGGGEVSFVVVVMVGIWVGLGRRGGKGKRHTGVAVGVAVLSTMAVEIALCLLGELVGVGVLVCVGHGCLISYRSSVDVRSLKTKRRVM